MKREETHSTEGSSLRHRSGGTMKSMAAWVGGVLSGVTLPMLAWAQERPYDWGMHYMWGATGIGMMVMMLVFWGLVIVALVLGIRWLITQGREPRADSLLEILKKRYARGEIDNEEYEAKKREIS